MHLSVKPYIHREDLYTIVTGNYWWIGFCEVLGIDRETFDNRITEISNKRKNRGFSRYTPQVFLSQLNKVDIAPLQESLYRFPGIALRKRTLRDYTYKAAAHALGSVGEVSQKDIDNDNYYILGDYAGRDGIEKTYESVLRGIKGEEILMRDSRGRLQGRFRDGAEDVPAQAGTDLTLTLDIQLQLLAEQLLSGKIGSVVAIEPSTGEILTMASSPTWNPQLLVGKIRSENYAKLSQDETKPLYNRATQAMYSPGSTFKVIQALVCLQEKGIWPTTEYPCNGPQSTPIKCTHHHGSPVSLEEAIEQSCNPYFWCAFRDMLQKNGYGDDNEPFRKRYQLWRDDVLEFGFGQRFTDTDLGEQSTGSIPTIAFYDRYYGKKGWKAITIRSLSIGQGEILVTPLQLANEAAIIANGGYYITPHLNRNDSMKSRVHRTNIGAHDYQLVKIGMARVMTNGTGKRYSINDVEICGKTGTAQNNRGKDHSIFIGFAPKDKPKIAIAVIVENAGYGSTWAVPIATLMMEYYLKGEIEHTDLYHRMATSSTMQLNATQQ